MKNSDSQLKESVSLLILELQIIVSNCYLEYFEQPKQVSSWYTYCSRFPNYAANYAPLLLIAYFAKNYASIINASLKSNSGQQCKTDIDFGKNLSFIVSLVYSIAPWYFTSRNILYISKFLVLSKECHLLKNLLPIFLRSLPHP